MMPTEPENLDTDPETFEPIGDVVGRVMANLVNLMADASKQEERQ